MIGFAPYSVTQIASVLIRSPLETLKVLPEVVRGDPGLFLDLPRAIVQRVCFEWQDCFRKPEPADDFLKNLRR